jgi:CBS domain containing-hemolysin-like protein
MSNPWVIGPATVALIALSAFFVAVEFALLAAKRHRLEDAAATSRSARAALRSSGELTLLLAGSQLGITACTLALGAITKPAVHHWLTPWFETWGVALWVADVAGFVLALIIVTFLHLVVGEMAPKSWAIAHPEFSATVLAIPMRGFMWLTRPLLIVLNEMANWCLAKVGVEPANEISSGQNSDDLRHLVAHSATAGTLDPTYSHQLSIALELEALTVAELIGPASTPIGVPSDATVAEVRRAALESGHLRILLTDESGARGFVHVRDTLLHDLDSEASALMRPVLTFEPGTPVYSALTSMRETSNHLAVVAGRDGDEAMHGVITLTDVLDRLFPQPTDGAIDPAIGL